MHFDAETIRLWLQTTLQIAAFGGAVLVAVWQQKRLDDRVRDDRKRKHLASRVTLPISLAKINRYAEECAALLKRTYPAEGGGTIHIRSGAVPTFPQDVISAFRDCLESGEGNITQPLAELIRFCQAQNSRMVGAFSRLDSDNFVSEDMYNKIIYDALRLWVFTEEFYAYGRLESDIVRVDVPFDRIEAASGVLGMNRIQGFSKFVGSIKERS